MNGKLIAHHVGGRGFGVAFYPPHLFKDDVIHVLHEADVDCAMKMIGKNFDQSTIILPYCLGEGDYDSTLKITHNPYFSSLRRPNCKFFTNTCEVELSGEIEDIPVTGVHYDAIYADEMAVEKEIPVRVRSLDSLLASREIGKELSPDFISLDTQGTEFEVLLGAVDAVNRSVLAIIVEVEFVSMYDGQKLFGEVFGFAREHNFHFGGFQYLQDLLPGHLAIGLRSRGFVGFGDCIFFKDLEEVRKQFINNVEFAAAAAKLAFIAFSFGYSSFAIAALRAAMGTEINESERGLLRQRVYFRLAEEVDAAIREMPERYLHTNREELVVERRIAIARRQAAIDQRQVALLARARNLIEDIKAITDRECSAAKAAAEKAAEARQFVRDLRIHQVAAMVRLRRIAQEAIAQLASAQLSAVTARQEADKVREALARLERVVGLGATEPLLGMVEEVEQGASMSATFAAAAQNSVDELTHQRLFRFLRALRAPLRAATGWKPSPAQAPATPYRRRPCGNRSAEPSISTECLLGHAAGETIAPDEVDLGPSTLEGSDDATGVSAVELVLARYGFEAASAELKRRRCIAAPYVRVSG